MLYEGCVNGGGQIKAADDDSSKDLYLKAESIYSSVRYIKYSYSMFCGPLSEACTGPSQNGVQNLKEGSE